MVFEDGRMGFHYEYTSADALVLSLLCVWGLVGV